MGASLPAPWSLPLTESPCVEAAQTALDQAVGGHEETHNRQLQMLNGRLSS